LAVATGDLLLLKTGSVNYYRESPEGKQILIIRLSPGDTFGLGTLLAKPAAYIGTAEALLETELYVWQHTWIRQFLERHPLLLENALRIGLEYIRLYSDRHAALMTKNAEGRLAGMLALAGIRVGRQNARGLEVQITNEHLASLADVNKFTVSRLLKKWATKGTVEKRRGKVVILCPEKMLGAAAGIVSQRGR
jgi:CRP-like cAMP-binding protein